MSICNNYICLLRLCFKLRQRVADISRNITFSQSRLCMRMWTAQGKRYFCKWAITFKTTTVTTVIQPLPPPPPSLPCLLCSVPNKRGSLAILNQLFIAGRVCNWLFLPFLRVAWPPDLSVTFVPPKTHHPPSLPTYNNSDINCGSWG